VEFLAAQFVKEKAANPKRQEPVTVRKAIEKYIALCETLSPTTVSGYEKILKYAFKDLMEQNVETLTIDNVQVAINAEAKKKVERTGKQLSPKTVKNEWGLVAAALKQICNKSFDVKLTKNQKTPSILPEPIIVLKAIKGSTVELPCLLAMWMGLRMSEVRGIKCSSIKNGYLSITQVTVSVDGVDITKSDTKTQASKRVLRIPAYIMQLIEQTESYQSYKASGVDSLLITQTNNAIYHQFKNLMEKADVKLTFHGLRHLYASISLNILSIPPKIVQRSGGWSSSAVMDNVYSQVFDTATINADNKRDEYFNKILEREENPQ